ncbi:unnamed protein product [Trifolium pratense]|uniref:Uncharacterized protein n=1 Tax=Trifolium pratense TaxID=57577 RepID=A0ACB0K716_TRIPR|nr:unnamed protein product [Trifolium pratense]
MEGLLLRTVFFYLPQQFSTVVQRKTVLDCFDTATLCRRVQMKGRSCFSYTATLSRRCQIVHRSGCLDTATLSRSCQFENRSGLFLQQRFLEVAKSKSVLVFLT